MSSTKVSRTPIALDASSDVTDATLKSAPARLLTFLQGTTEPAIRAKFMTLGWSKQCSDEAWGLLEELKALSVFPAPSPEPDPVEIAVQACEEWQNTGLTRARAMVQLRLPEQAAFLFGDIQPGKGTAAVLNISTFLQRCQDLQNSPERKMTRKADHDALAIIDETGASKEVLATLAGYVATVHAAPLAPAPGTSETDKLAAKRREVLRKIHAWVSAWSDMARTVIGRRDQLIRLGIARRRPRRNPGRPITPVAPTAPVAPGTAGTTSPVAPAGATAGAGNSSAPQDAEEPAPSSRAA